MDTRVLLRSHWIALLAAPLLLSTASCGDDDGGGDPCEGVADRCTEADASQCTEAGWVQYCEANTEGCLVWSSPTSCNEGMVCTDGACECTNPCTDGQRDCSGDILSECYYTPGGCFDWGMIEDCAATGGTCDESATPTCVGAAGCGDGAINGAEACDGTDLGTATCVTEGFYGGDLACTAACALDLSGCTGRCGDGAINGAEACDGDDLGDETCQTQGFHGGTLGCTSGCALDVSACEGYCGDGEITAGEDCDGDNLGGASCATLGFHAGTLECTIGCTLDPSGCSETCGDGVVNGPEACDGTHLGAATCESEGFYGGTLACTAGCALDHAGCVGYCGDEELNGAEACDGTNLGGHTCADLGFYQGSVTCTAACEPSYTGCSEWCGDAVRNGAEVCDGADLGGATCVSRGFAAGDLACAAGCGAFVTTGCLPAVTIVDCWLQSPLTLTDHQGTQHAIHGQVRIPGVTDLTTGPDADERVVVQLGVGADGSAPSTWTWADAAPNAGFSSPDVDEWVATLTVPSSTGSPYDYAYRVSGDAGVTWTYCDATGGAWSAADAGALIALPLPGCGNGYGEDTEACDGADHRGETCETLGYYGGTLGCLADCTFDLSGCWGQCGDDVKNGTEVCDGPDLGGASCASLGYVSGPLSCRADCQALVVDACVPPLTIGWCNLQWPVELHVTEDSTQVVYGRLWIDGQTTLTTGPDPDARVVAQVGVGPDGSSPSVDATAWTWSAATPNAGFVDAADDEYQGVLTVPAAAGSPYDFAYRFSGDGGLTWTYCDRDGDAYTTDNTGALDASVPAGCGNGTLEVPEQCDGVDLDGATCQTLGYYTGTLACTWGCQYDVSGCAERCGDATINGLEVCDGADLGGLTCVDYGFHSGALACSADCGTIDAAGCHDYCGDLTRNGPEACDATDLGGLTCADYGFHTGVLACSADCGTVLTTGCSEYCGDDVINGGELCDGADLGALDCGDYGYYGGVLACAADCLHVDESGCQDHCGDGVRNGPEACDAADFGGLDCTDFGRYTGTLACSADCSVIDAAACTGTCGDGVRNGPEACDGVDFGGFTCASYGFDSGALACTGACGTIDTSGCFDALVIGWCNTQWPESIDGPADGTTMVYGQLWIAGLTDVNDGPDPDGRLVAEVGVGPDGSDPVADAAEWTWYPASPNAGFSHADNDEYLGSLTHPPASGSPYDYAYRFSGDRGATWTYCDGNGMSYDPAEARPMTTYGGLFFSEYYEGSSGTNKALELHNASSAAIQLNGCTLYIYANGSAIPTANLPLPSFSLAAGGTWVICHSSSGTPITSRCNYPTSSSAIGFNGDDALELRCGTTTVDVIGQIGFRPAAGWWGTAPIITANHTLRRKASVSWGDAVGSDVFDPAEEWTDAGADVATGLGVYP